MLPKMIDFLEIHFSKKFLTENEISYIVTVTFATRKYVYYVYSIIILLYCIIILHYVYSQLFKPPPICIVQILPGCNHEHTNEQD